MFAPVLKRAPFVRLVLPLCAGILLQLYLSFSLQLLLTGLCLLLCMLIAFAWLPLWMHFTAGWVRGIVLHLMIVIAGAALMYQGDVRRNSLYFVHQLQPADQLLITINEPLQEKTRSYRTTAQVTAVLRNNDCLPVKGELLLYLQKDTMAAALQCGNRLLIPNTLQVVSRSGNPGAFDYRRYCAFRQIYRQAYVQKGQWRVIPGKGMGFINDRLLSARAYCLRILRQHIGGAEAALAAALLIGYRYDLDRSMVQDYTNTGIVHIIAISGMHLALIYGGLLWILQWWPPHRFAALVKAMLIITFLWAFTLLTGASASVLRATVMFTFITTGKFILHRYTNIYNSLAASAFLLLCYDPYLLTDAGFQLSYLAVLSILICYKPVYNLLELRNRWLDKVWDAVALTLSAQLVTLPVCLYYFQQFPLLFLPANLLAVPASTMILYGEIVLLLISPFPALAHYTGITLKWLMICLNAAVAWIGHLPGALIENIHTTLYGTICSYIIMAALLLWWLCKWRKGALLSAAICLLWAVWHTVDGLQQLRQRKMIIYNIPAHTAVDIIHGRKVQFTGDNTVIRSDSLWRMHVQPARVFLGVAGDRQPEENNLRSRYIIEKPPTGGQQFCMDHDQSGHFINLGNKRLVIIDSALAIVDGIKKFKTDYILLSHNPAVDIKQLNALYRSAVIIFDASNSRRNIQQWKSDCYALTLRFFSVPDQGAYVVNF